jgi:hypothetical protein
MVGDLELNLGVGVAIAAVDALVGLRLVWCLFQDGGDISAGNGDGAWAKVAIWLVGEVRVVTRVLMTRGGGCGGWDAIAIANKAAKLQQGYGASWTAESLQHHRTPKKVCVSSCEPENIMPKVAQLVPCFNASGIVFRSSLQTLTQPLAHVPSATEL